jgi:RNA polymerase sigma factor (sigma-70 family)
MISPSDSSLGTLSAYRALTDGDLVQMCLDGHGLAWETLIDRYHDLIYSIVVTFKLDACAREDVVQNVGLALNRGLHTLKDRSKFYSWLITTTRRECMALVRHKEEDLAPEREIEEPLDPGPTLEESILVTEKHEIVREVLATWDNPCSSLLRMLYFEDRTFAQTAAGLDGSPDGIGPKRSRCLAKLRRLLARRGITGI